jgi:hypothetical protein
MQAGEIDIEHIAVEWLILADAAQVSGGKLFLLGGGWDVLVVNSEFPVTQHCAVAVAVKVPWAEANQPHAIEIGVTDLDRRTSLVAIAGQLEVGRPPGTPPGQTQRAQLAADLNVTFPEPGTYVVYARVGNDERTAALRVIPGPMLQFRERLTKGPNAPRE